MKEFFFWCVERLLSLFSPVYESEQQQEISVEDFFVGVAYHLERDHGLVFLSFTKENRIVREETHAILGHLIGVFKEMENPPFSNFEVQSLKFFIELDYLDSFERMPLDTSGIRLKNRYGRERFPLVDSLDASGDLSEVCELISTFLAENHQNCLMRIHPIPEIKFLVASPDCDSDSFDQPPKAA